MTLDLKRQAQLFLNMVFEQCYKNKALKKALLENPIETLEKITGKPNRLPTGYTLKIEDQSNPDYIYLNIPPNPKN